MIETISGKLSKGFTGKEVTEWRRYLKSQDKDVLDYVVDNLHVLWKSDYPLRGIDQFHRMVQKRQLDICLKQAELMNAQSCPQCQGTTWLDSDPSGSVPCPLCRPSTHAQWAAGSYQAGFTIEEDTGPQNSYAAAAKVSQFSGVPVSAIRCTQWSEHIAKGLTGYPEEVTDASSEPGPQESQLPQGDLQPT